MEARAEVRKIQGRSLRVEYEIRMIMRKEIGIKQKAEIICTLTNWNLKKLINVMERYGTFGTYNRSKVIAKFWPRKK